MTVALRAVVAADLEAFFEHQRDPEAVRLAAVPARDRDAFTAHWARILADDTVVIRAIDCDGALAGNVLSFERGGVREVGYWIARPFWGRGVATAALLEFLAVDAARPLHARVARENRGSVRVLEKCGFAVETEVPDPEGDGVDELLMRLDA